MAYGANLVEALDSANLGIEQAFEDELTPSLWGRQVSEDLLLAAIRELHLDEGVVETYTLYTALSQNGLVGHVVKLILNA